MSEKSLHFTDISVYRALGIQQGDEFEFSGISSGVNLICGPNGSGKSTTALIIQELLWPGRTGLERPSANGKFTIDNTRWS